MTFKHNFDRPQFKVGAAELTAQDIDAGVDTAVIKLPAGSVIVGGMAITSQAWNSTTSDTLDVGDADDPDRYLAAGAIRAINAYVPLVPTGHVHTVNNEITVKWKSGGGTPTEGKTTLLVWYIILGSSDSVHG